MDSETQCGESLLYRQLFVRKKAPQQTPRVPETGRQKETTALGQKAGCKTAEAEMQRERISLPPNFIQEFQKLKKEVERLKREGRGRGGRSREKRSREKRSRERRSHG